MSIDPTSSACEPPAHAGTSSPVTTVDGMSRLRLAILLAGLLLAGAAIGSGLALTRHGTSRSTSLAASRPSAATRGWAFHRKVPAATVTTASGAPFSLRSLHGKVIVLAPSLTLCHEVCPMTTQALMRMRSAVATAGLSDRVAFVEATVDPWRDSPARLRAYDRLTGARLLQLTGNVKQMRSFWGFFGIGFRRVPQGRPPDTDWWTGRAETVDVEHVDGLFLIDQRGYERRFFAGIANVGGHLSPALRSLLSRDGRENLAHPLDGWTVDQVLAAVGRLLHTHIT